jgi:GMP synthase-like glutamine amidotransferase
MNVLALIHGENVRPGIFADVVARRGGRLREWSLAWGPLPPGEVDALMVFGGSMHPDEERRHPWLLDELRLLAETELPVLGVCLGAQLLARAAGAAVRPAPAPEVGWHEVELTAAAGDPVVGALPPRFEALQWHWYTYDVPQGAVELARSAACTQAFRLGDAWGVQFHPEVTAAHVETWAAEDGVDADALRVETDARLPRWQELGARLCDAFLDYSTGRSSRLDHSCQEPA